MKRIGRFRTMPAAIALLALAGACGTPPDAVAPQAVPAAAVVQVGVVRVSDARVRTPVADQDKTAAYFTVTNDGTVPLVLTGAESANVRAIEIHNIERDADMVRMRRLRELVVEPGATARLEPGGLHLMLFGVTSLDEPFMITLLDSNGERFDVPFRITAPGAE